MMISTNASPRLDDHHHHHHRRHRRDSPPRAQTRHQVDLCRDLSPRAVLPPPPSPPPHSLTPLLPPLSTSHRSLPLVDNRNADHGNPNNNNNDHPDPQPCPRAHGTLNEPPSQPHRQTKSSVHAYHHLITPYLNPPATAGHSFAPGPGPGQGQGQGRGLQGTIEIDSPTISSPFAPFTQQLPAGSGSIEWTGDRWGSAYGQSGTGTDSGSSIVAHSTTTNITDLTKQPTPTPTPMTTTPTNSKRPTKKQPSRSKLATTKPIQPIHRTGSNRSDIPAAPYIMPPSAHYLGVDQAGLSGGSGFELGFGSGSGCGFESGSGSGSGLHTGSIPPPSTTLPFRPYPAPSLTIQGEKERSLGFHGPSVSPLNSINSLPISLAKRGNEGLVPGKAGYGEQVRTEDGRGDESSVGVEGGYVSPGQGQGQMGERYTDGNVFGYTATPNMITSQVSGHSNTSYFPGQSGSNGSGLYSSSTARPSPGLGDPYPQTLTGGIHTSSISTQVDHHLQVHHHQQQGWQRSSPYLHPSSSIGHPTPINRHVSYNGQHEGLLNVGMGEKLGRPARPIGGRSGARSTSGLRVGIRSVSATDVRGVGVDPHLELKSTRYDPPHPYRPSSRLPLPTLGAYRSRPPSPRYPQSSIEPRRLHTTQNTPVGSPESTPAPNSGEGGVSTTDFSTGILVFPSQGRKAKYTRSRTGCLGCRAKRVKCDEARPVCQKCVDGKKQACIYPALHELPKATIRALAARKRIDSGGESTGDEVADDRKRVKASAESQGGTSVDAYMNEIDDEGNMRNEYGLLVPVIEPRPVPLGFLSYQQQLYTQQKKQQLEHQRQEQLQAGNSLDWASGRSTSVAPPYTASAQGYTGSISSYNLNITPDAAPAQRADSHTDHDREKADITSRFENGLYHDDSGKGAVSTSNAMTDSHQSRANNVVRCTGSPSAQHHRSEMDTFTPPDDNGSWIDYRRQ